MVGTDTADKTLADLNPATAPPWRRRHDHDRRRRTVAAERRHWCTDPRG